MSGCDEGCGGGITEPQHIQSDGVLLVFDDLLLQESNVQCNCAQYFRRHNSEDSLLPQLPPIGNDTGSVEGGVGKRREEIIDEIISTEQTYLTGLTILLDEYVTPLKKFIRDVNLRNSKKLLKEFHFMFSPINVIRQVNQQLLSDLICVRTSNCQHMIMRIGYLFQQISPMLKTYTVYVNNYNRMQNRITELLENSSRLNNCLKEIEYKMSNENKNTFMQYLITPAQRLTRYHLLLGELMKYTNEFSVEYNLVRAAFDQTKGVAEYVNSSIHDYENRLKLSQLQAEVIGINQGLGQYLIQSHRKFIAEGSNFRMLRKDNKKAKRVKLILFSDMLVLVNRKNKYKMHCSFTQDPIPWVDLNVIIDCKEPSHTLGSDCAECQRMFQFLTKDQVLTLRAESEKEKKDFVDRMQEVLDFLRKNNVTARSASKADPVAQESLESAMVITRKFSFSRKNSDSEYHQINDTASSSEQTVTVKSPTTTINILGLNLAGLTAQAFTKQKSPADPRLIQSARVRTDFSFGLPSALDPREPITSPRPSPRPKQHLKSTFDRFCDMFLGEAADFPPKFN